MKAARNLRPQDDSLPAPDLSARKIPRPVQEIQAGWVHRSLLGIGRRHEIALRLQLP
jgi:hypothetical protein